MNEIVL